MRYVLIFLAALLSNAALSEERADVVLEVRNMTCGVCPITVRKALGKVDGVSKVTVDYEKSTAVVSYDPARTTPAELTRATANAGFPSTVRE